MSVELAYANEDRAVVARDVLSLREAVVLAEINEKKVRKDIETGVLMKPRVYRFGEAHLGVTWKLVFTLAAVYRNRFLNASLRKLALEKLSHVNFGSYRVATTVHSHSHCAWYDCDTYDAPEEPANCGKINIDNYVVLDISRAIHDVAPRIDLYAEGLKRIEEKDGVLGGEAVFRGTRTSVHHIGKMNAPLDEILTDYPHLTESDVEFARIYHRAHPPVGRPRTSVEAESDVAPAVG